MFFFSKSKYCLAWQCPKLLWLSKFKPELKPEDPSLEARFAEGNRAEAVIPLQNKTAMQPFVDAVADGLTQTLAPMFASFSSGQVNNNNESMRPLYVGTLIADERGLRELNRKMQVIQLKEEGRRG